MITQNWMKELIYAGGSNNNGGNLTQLTDANGGQ